MSYKSILLGAGILLVVLGGVGTVLALLVVHEPSFYRRSEVPAGLARKKFDKECTSQIALLISNSTGGNLGWYQHFTDAQINSYLKESFLRGNMDRALLPEEITDPRLTFEPDKVRLAFRYGRGAWSTVISADLRVWLAKKEPNAVVLELQGLHAGALPITAQALLRTIVEGFQGKNLDVKWYRYNNHPCALLRFRSETGRPTVQLTDLEFRQGMLVLGFRSVAAGGASGPLASARPALAPLGN